MNSNVRLQVCGVIIVLSGMYAVTIVKDPEVASAVAAGYIALILTAFVLVNLWKKP